MKTIVVNELKHINISDTYVLNLSDLNAKDCTGCWSCWWKTPGKCIFKNLNEFYYEYVHADKVVFFCEVKQGFVSGNIKTLFDRMIPLFMPYTSISIGESMHVKTSLSMLKRRTLFMKTIILNCSPKMNINESNTEIFINEFMKEKCTVKYDIKEDNSKLAKSFSDYDTILILILIFLPLYIHAMPGSVMKFIEHLDKHTLSGKNLGFFIQAGFPETDQEQFVENYNALQILVNYLKVFLNLKNFYPLVNI